jgi:hypothetical protein
MKESHIETEKKTELIITKENAQISKQKKLKSRKLFVDTNEIEKKQKKKKYEDEENLAYDSKYSSKIKQEEDKIEKAKSSTSTSSQNDNNNDNLNNVNLNQLTYSKYPIINKYDRKMSSPICCYYDGSDKYLSVINSSLVDFSKSNNFIDKETFFNNDYYKNYENKFRPRSFGNINELNFNNNKNDNLKINNLNDISNQNYGKFNYPYYNFGNFNYESKYLFLFNYFLFYSSR